MKKELRKKFRNWMKQNVTSDFSLSGGEILKEKLAGILAQVDHPKVSIFISKLPEISTAPLIDHLYTIGAKVYIPSWNLGEMWMCHVESKNEYQKLVEETPAEKIPMPTTNMVPIAVQAHIQFNGSFCLNHHVCI